MRVHKGSSELNVEDQVAEYLKYAPSKVGGSRFKVTDCLYLSSRLGYISELNLFTWNDNIQSFRSKKVKPRVSSSVSPPVSTPFPRYMVRQFQSPTILHCAVSISISVCMHCCFFSKTNLKTIYFG